MSDFASQAAESPSGSDDIRTSLLKQPTEHHNGKESRGWIREAEWSNCIERNFDFDRRSPSICRVPHELKKESKEGEAYIPQRVSLGPYHHRSAELPPMNSHKRRALDRMMTRPDTIDHEFPNRAKKEIALLEKEIRESYEENIDCDGETLGMMLSLDGCFILEILRTLRGDILHHELFSSMTNGDYYEPLFQVKKIIYTGFDILNDILKLENQIPLVVLRKLLELELKSADHVENELWKVLCPSFLCVMYPFNYRKDFNQWSWPLPDEQEVHHLLGLLRTLIVSPPVHTGERAVDVGIRRYMGGDEGHSVLQNEDEEEEAEESMNGVGSILRAVELIRAGVKFKPCAGGIKDIHFDTKSDTIYLPPIEIADSTEILFRNLIAYEMCKPFEHNYVACYVCLMDQLIDSEEDVTLLRKKGILTNHLGSDAEVAKLFNGLCKGVAVSLEGEFRKLTGKVLKFFVKNKFKRKFNVYCTELVSEYCSSPWKILGVVAATVLLLLTVVQTIFAILSVYK